MNYQKLLKHIHRALWFITTVFTGMLTGFLASHSEMLSRFFSDSILLRVYSQQGVA
jgi:hypothetical protein